MAVTAHNVAPLSMAASQLKEDQIQYLMVRIPLQDKDSDASPGAENSASGVRDVYVVWTGPLGSHNGRRDKSSHLHVVRAVLAPVQPMVCCSNRAKLTESELRRTDPKSQWPLLLE